MIFLRILGFVSKNEIKSFIFLGLVWLHTSYPFISDTMHTEQKSLALHLLQIFAYFVNN